MSLDAWTFDGPHTDAIPIGDFTYRERTDSYTGNLGDNSTATRIFLVDWSMQSLFIDDLLGFATVTTTGGLARVLPEEHPDYSYFYATDVSVKPVGRPGTTGVNQSTYDVAEIAVTYKPLPYAVREDDDIETELDRFVSRTPQVKAEYLTYNNTGMKWVGGALDGQSLQFTPGIIVPGMTQTYTWHTVPAVLPTFDDANSEYRIPTLANALPLLGKCNATEFDGQPPGCVVLTQVDGKMVMPKLKDGFYYWEIVYTFDMKNYGVSVDNPSEYAGVNYIYCPADGNFHLVTVDGTPTGRRIYTSGELNQLFVIPT